MDAPTIDDCEVSKTRFRYLSLKIKLSRRQTHKRKLPQQCGKIQLNLLRNSEMQNHSNINLQPNPIRIAADSAALALGFRDHFTPGIEEPRRIPAPAVGSTTMNLTEWLSLKPTPGDVWNLNAIDAGERVGIDPQAVIAEHSRCVQAGARLIIAAPKPAPDLGGQPVFYTDAGLVRAVDPAQFATIADGTSAPASGLPNWDAPFSWPTAPSSAFSTVITRAQRRAIGGPEIFESLMIAVLRGLGELADSVLLNAILSANPVAFSFGAAAARHAKFDDLRAIVGTNGSSASVLGDGRFVAGGGITVSGGVQAELSATIAKTVIGQFSRAAVAFRPELSLFVNRLNTDGDVELSVFCNCLGLVPNPADFWTA